MLEKFAGDGLRRGPSLASSSAIAACSDNTCHPAGVPVGLLQVTSGGSGAERSKTPDVIEAQEAALKNICRRLHRASCRRFTRPE